MNDVTPEQPGIEVTHEPEIPVFLVQLWLCDPCLDGVGEQCHTPGCSLYIHDVPRPAIRGSQGVTVLGPALEPFLTREQFAARQPQAWSGKAAYETWRAAVPDVACNVPGGAWDDLPATVQAGFDALAAMQPQPAPGDLPKGHFEHLQAIGAADNLRSQLRETRHALASLLDRCEGSNVLTDDEADEYRRFHRSPEPEQPAPEPGAARPPLGTAWRLLNEAREELAALRGELYEIGVLAANAPEDGDCFAVCEEIAMRIAAHGVPS